MAIKQEPIEADLPGAGLHPDALQRTLDTVTSALPQLITAVTTLAQTAADMKRDAETTSTGLAAVLTEMKQQLTTVASAQLQTAAVLAELKTEMGQMRSDMRMQRTSNTAAISSKLDDLTAAVREEGKEQALRDRRATLQRALANAETASFDYYYGTSLEPRESTDRARRALHYFCQRVGYILDNACYVSDKCESQPTEDHRRAYREALREQIEQVTGIQPSLEYEASIQGGMEWVLYWPDD